MKAKFSKRIKYIPEFDGNRQLPEGEQAVCWIKPLNMNDLLNLMDALQTANVEEETGMKELIGQFGELVPKYVELQNMTDEDGDAIDSNTIISYPFFLGLAGEILGEMAQVSMPDEEEIKNSNTQPGSQVPPTQ